MSQTTYSCITFHHVVFKRMPTDGVSVLKQTLWFLLSTHETLRHKLLY